jgi:hypothetical protein
MVILLFEFLRERLESHPVLLWSQIRNVRKKYVTIMLLEMMNGAVQEETGRSRWCDTGRNGWNGAVLEAKGCLEWF